MSATFGQDGQQPNHQQIPRERGASGVAPSFLARSHAGHFFGQPSISSDKTSAQPISADPQLPESVAKVLNYNPETGEFFRADSGEPVRGHVLNGYTRFSLGPLGTHYAHRLAWMLVTGRVPQPLDHVDGERSNNRWSNLREATPQQNSANARRSRSNTVGLKGVTTYRGKFRAQICVDGRKTWLGDFETQTEAAAAYAGAARLAFGDFSRSDACNS